MGNSASCAKRVKRGTRQPELPSKQVTAAGQLQGVATSIDDVRGLLDRVTFTQGCPLPCFLEVLTPQQNALEVIEVRATARVRDRHTGEPVTVNASEELRLPLACVEAFARVVRLLDRVWLHELRESIQLDGELVLDPHDPARARALYRG